MKKAVVNGCNIDRTSELIRVLKECKKSQEISAFSSISDITEIDRLTIGNLKIQIFDSYLIMLEQLSPELVYIYGCNPQCKSVIEKCLDFNCNVIVDGLMATNKEEVNILMNKADNSNKYIRFYMPDIWKKKIYFAKDQINKQVQIRIVCKVYENNINTTGYLESQFMILLHMLFDVLDVHNIASIQKISSINSS